MRTNATALDDARAEAFGFWLARSLADRGCSTPLETNSQEASTKLLRPTFSMMLLKAGRHGTK
jgi:hypothetical protein